MRCKNCGGILDFLFIGNGGKRYYQCRQGLTGFEPTGARKSRIFPCNTVQDKLGNLIPKGQTLAYMTEGKAKIFKAGIDL